MSRKLAALLAALMLTFGLAGTSVAKAPASSGGVSGGSTSAGQMKPMKPMTNAERKAAAVRAAKARKAAGVATTPSVHVATGVTNATGAGSTIPTGNPTNAPLSTTLSNGATGTDYFGTTPNYANSPLPTSVSIQGDGVDAFATATVNTDGTIGAITVVNAGSGYTDAATTVTVIGGGGNGATGTPTIDPLTGAIKAIAVANPGVGYDTVSGIQKFVDALPQLGPTGANGLGQYLPVAVPDTTSFPAVGKAPAADYYEIAVVQYVQRMSSSLPPTTLRGYVQVETAANAAVSHHFPLTYPDGSPILDNKGVQVLAVDPPQYLGPVIVAQKDRPVRVKFDNYLPTGTGGDLFIPVDPTIMGAGMGPNGGLYSQNRATLHLHGGVTPWISDGTPDQWTTPAGATEQYPKGVSTGYVPDMWYDAAGNDIASCDGQTTCTVAGATTDPGLGHMTFYYTNQQSARLMFYHDHSYGTTRLNVYAGEAAGYLVQDTVEQALVTNGTIPATQVPLVIEDKTFVPSPAQLAAEDPTWNATYYGGYGNLWFPHVYMPNQNPGDMSGANPMGRWDYGQWFWPVFQTQTPTINNPLCTSPGVQSTCPPGENAVNPGVPNPSIVPESFMDTMTVNGTVYPYLQVGQQAVRFRILNASNDRTINLSLYHAGSETGGVYQPCNGAVWTGTTLNANGCSGEVPMVPAVKGGVGTAGYTYPDQLDGRQGGVPDSRARGPQMIQIGTEGGFLSKPAVLPNQPIGYNYNRRDIVVLNVSNKNLTLGPAERADVVVDFSGTTPGDTFILYNDSPAPMPAFDSRYDYYTGDPDQTMTGGAPTTLPGYGPNTRTVMQIQVTGPSGPGANLAALQAAIPTAYGQTQAAPVVPEQGYDQAFGTTSPADPYARIQSMSGTFNTGTITSLTLTNGGSGYTSSPTVVISGGGGAGATAMVSLNGNGGIASLTLNDPGTGYTSAPNVTFSGGGGTGAAATASISTGVASFAVTAGGIGYTSPPAVSVSGGGGSGATGTAVLAPSGVGTVSVTAGGAYQTPPSVGFSGGGGSGATATAVLGGAPVASATVTAGGTGYTSAPSVSISGGSGTGAAGSATLTPTSIGSLALTNPGSLYVTAPTVTFNGGGGTGATATTSLVTTQGSLGAVNVTIGGAGYTLVPTVTLSAPPTGGTQATAAVTAMAPTGVGAVRVTNGGRCASTTPVPTVTFTSVNGAGSGATGTATIGGNPRRVTGVTVTKAGSGYTMPPSVAFGGTNCTGVTATTSLQSTSVLSIGVTNPGSGYTRVPTVQIQGGGGTVTTNARATAILAYQVASITLGSAGSGFTSAPTLTLSAPQFAGGVTATATATLTPTSVASVAISAGGNGYLSAPGVAFSGGGGSGAAATTALGPAPVASVTVSAAGSGYTSPPAVSFTGGGGTGGASATAALLPSSVQDITLGNAGAGYNSAPTVSLSGGGGSGATATAALVPVGITLALTSGGTGYTSAPTVTIDPPATTGGTTAAATAVVGATSVTNLTLTNPGSGFVSTPTVTIVGGGGTGATATAAITVAPVTLAFQPMGIQELFDPFYGRMNATMSMEIPNTNGTIQTTIPYGYIDPPTEIINTAAAGALGGATPLQMLPDGTQIWKFTHNGVDTHSVHFHMFNIELINRVGWDGAVRPPDANEMGWKDTVRMSPLEDAIVAIKPIVPDLPWPLPNSIRPLDVTAALGDSGIQYTNIDPNGNPVTVRNHLVNYGWEYVFHCHLLGHEENDMMRPMLFGIAPLSPTVVSAVAPSATAAGPSVDLKFVDNSVNETGFTIQRSADGGATWSNAGTVTRAAPVLNPDNSVTDFGVSTGDVLTFTDTGVTAGTAYSYRVVANDVIGDTQTAGFPSQSIDSVPSAASAAVTP